MQTEINKAISVACRVLTFRRRTRRELELYLERKGFSAEVIRYVVDMMEKYGYIDDQAFTFHWVEQRLAKRGLPGLKRELMERGVDTCLIDEALTGLDPESEYNAAMELAKKKMRQCGGACPFSRLAGFLQRRGYSYNVIGRVCRSFGDNGVKP